MKRPDQDGATLVSSLMLEEPGREAEMPPSHWAERALLLWKYRRSLFRVAAVSLLVSFGLAFAIPKRYTATASIMPPESQSSGAMLLAALAGRGGLGSLGNLASGLFSQHSSTALFMSLLESGTVSAHLVSRFDLMNVYHSRYRVDAGKHLARVTKITDDKKSGVITIKVSDTDPARARDLAQAYLDELNRIVNETSTSAARQERIFIENRLRGVQDALESAQLELSDFSSRNSTVDLTAQTRAMVDVGARLQGEIVAERSGLESMRQVYSDQNIRVREAEARIGSLQHELDKLAGTSPPPGSSPSNISAPARDSTQLYPPLRQLPRLAVRYTDLYRRVKVQEAVFELLTQQYEMARIEEAKDIPVVRVLDAPGIPEKKSFPPRLLLIAVMTFLSVASACALVLVREYWAALDSADPRRRLAAAVGGVRFRRRRALRPIPEGVL